MGVSNNANVGGNFGGFAPSKCIVWVGNIITPKMICKNSAGYLFFVRRPNLPVSTSRPGGKRVPVRKKSFEDEEIHGNPEILAFEDWDMIKFVVVF